VKKLHTKVQNCKPLSCKNIYLWKCQKPDEKKRKADEQTLGDSSSTNRRLQQDISWCKQDALNESIFSFCLP